MFNSHFWAKWAIIESSHFEGMQRPARNPSGIFSSNSNTHVIFSPRACYLDSHSKITQFDSMILMEMIRMITIIHMNLQRKAALGEAYLATPCRALVAGQCGRTQCNISQRNRATESEKHFHWVQIRRIEIFHSISNKRRDIVLYIGI